MAHLRLVHDNKLTQVGGSATHPATNDYKSQTATGTSFTLTTSSISGNVAVIAYLPEHNASVTMTVFSAQPAAKTILNNRFGQIRRNDLVAERKSIVYAYKRSSIFPDTSPGTLTYDFSTNTVIGTYANSWQKVIPSGTDQLYVTAAVVYSTATTDSITIAEWSDAVPVNDTLDNLYTQIVYLYAVNTSPTSVPTYTAGTSTSTYTFQTNELSGSIPAGWSSTIPTLLPGQYLWITAAAISSVLEPVPITITDTTSTNSVSLASGYGGGKYVSAYLPTTVSNNTTYYVTFNTSVKVSRFIIGNYWSPKYNIPFGISTGYSDTSSSERLQSGDLYSTPGPRNKTMQFQLEYLTDEDKFQFFGILKTVGKLGCVFVSAFPEDSDKDKEQMFSIYGKLNNLSQITYAQYTRYTSSLELEEF